MTSDSLILNSHNSISRKSAALRFLQVPSDTERTHLPLLYPSNQQHLFHDPREQQQRQNPHLSRVGSIRLNARGKSKSVGNVLQTAGVKDVLSPGDWLKKSVKRHHSDSGLSGCSGLEAQLFNENLRSNTSENEAPKGAVYEQKLREIEQVITRRQELLGQQKRGKLVTPSELTRAEENFESLGNIFEKLLPKPLGMQDDAPHIGETTFDVDSLAELCFIERYFVHGEDGTESASLLTDAERFQKMKQKALARRMSLARNETDEPSLGVDKDGRPRRPIRTATEVAPQLPPLNRTLRFYIYYLIERKKLKDALKAINVALKRNPVNSQALFERVEIFKSQWMLVKRGEKPQIDLPQDVLDMMYTETLYTMKFCKNAKDLAKAYRNASFYFVEGGQYNAAVACCLASLRYDPSSAAVLSIISFVAQKLFAEQKSQDAQAEPQQRIQRINSIVVNSSIANMTSFKHRMPPIVINGIIELIQKYQAWKAKPDQPPPTIQKQGSLIHGKAPPKPVKVGSVSHLPHHTQRSTSPTKHAPQKTHVTLPRLFGSPLQNGSKYALRGDENSESSSNIEAGSIRQNQSSNSITSDNETIPTDDTSMLARLANMVVGRNYEEELSDWINNSLQRFNVPNGYHPLWAIAFEHAGSKLEHQGKYKDALTCYEQICGGASSSSKNLHTNNCNELWTTWDTAKRQSLQKRIRHVQHLAKRQKFKALKKKEKKSLCSRLPITSKRHHNIQHSLSLIKLIFIKRMIQNKRVLWHRECSHCLQHLPQGSSRPKLEQHFEYDIRWPALQKIMDYSIILSCNRSELCALYLADDIIRACCLLMQRPVSKNFLLASLEPTNSQGVTSYQPCTHRKQYDMKSAIHTSL